MTENHSLFHSRLQRNLVNWINQNTDRYETIQELHCIISTISPVPDIAVIETRKKKLTISCYVDYALSTAVQ